MFSKAKSEKKGTYDPRDLGRADDWKIIGAIRKYAWLPRRCGCQTSVWFDHYYEIVEKQTIYDRPPNPAVWHYDDFPVEIAANYNTAYLTKEEFLVERLSGTFDEILVLPE